MYRKKDVYKHSTEKFDVRFVKDHILDTTLSIVVMDIKETLYYYKGFTIDDVKKATNHNIDEFLSILAGKKIFEYLTGAVFTLECYPYIEPRFKGDTKRVKYCTLVLEEKSNDYGHLGNTIYYFEGLKCLKPNSDLIMLFKKS